MGMALSFRSPFFAALLTGMPTNIHQLLKN
jgi:hypothetical protein